jgi:hypothetical protein
MYGIVRTSNLPNLNNISDFFAVDFEFLGYDIVWSGRWVLLFRKNIQPELSQLKCSPETVVKT